ncbi:phage tail protein [Rhodospira trueperi]|uniref:Microcystin-dependent protein n=1 Tax=Rhodospira trueperi TaxID=69960 RepID=A0A1G7FFW6_9PROT|nr:tail fiber protein [Rhodospira trueperi]SDE74455.1 Microcystin-dependent protein [Rhodospira trueperi]
MMLQRQNPIRRSLIPVALGAAATLGALTVAPGSAGACGDPSTAYMGSVCMTAASFCPDHYLPADGSIVSISEYQALFSLLGCEYGGDCRSTFALPDLRGRSPVGAGQSPGLMPVQRGQKRGTEAVTQTVDTMAPHSHTITATGPATGGGTIDVVPGAASGTTQPAAGNTYLLGAVGGKANDGPYTTASAGGDPAKVAGVSVTMDSTGLAADPTGGGKPQINLPPQLGVLFCINADGLYPPRP